MQVNAIRGTLSGPDVKEIITFLGTMGYKCINADEFGGTLWKATVNGEVRHYRLYSHAHSNADGDRLPTQWQAYRTPR